MPSGPIASCPSIVVKQHQYTTQSKKSLRSGGGGVGAHGPSLEFKMCGGGPTGVALVAGSAGYA